MNKKGLVRRIEALENSARMAAASKRDQLQEMMIAAVAFVITPEELDEFEATVIKSGPSRLPADIEQRYKQRLDQISIERFGKTFSDLVASEPDYPSLSEVVDPGPHPPKTSRPHVIKIENEPQKTSRWPLGKRHQRQPSRPPQR